MTRPRLQTLRPRVAVLAPSRVRPHQVERTTGRKWMRIRAMVLAAAPLCPDCEAEGRVHVAEEVDHVLALADGGTDDLDNLVGRCRAHHLAKTQRERAARGG
jgi:5-methylcytosine-specific restriction protein A